MIEYDWVQDGLVRIQCRTGSNHVVLVDLLTEKMADVCHNRFIFGWKAESIIALIQYYTASWNGYGSEVSASASNSE